NRLVAQQKGQCTESRERALGENACPDGPSPTGTKSVVRSTGKEAKFAEINPLWPSHADARRVASQARWRTPRGAQPYGDGYGSKPDTGAGIAHQAAGAVSAGRNEAPHEGA